MKRFLPPLVVLTLAGVSGCGPSPSPGVKAPPKAPGSIQAGGATLVYPIMLRWAEVLEKEKALQLRYESQGSSKGISGMIDRSFDFGCSDAPMTDQELARASEVGGTVLHIPLVIGAVVPICNVPEISKPLHFDGPALAGIYLGKIRTWDREDLRALNPGVNLPARAIKPVHRKDGGGTTFLWTEYLSLVSPEWKARVGVGNQVAWPTGIESKGSEGMTGVVSRTPGSLGYTERTYALANKLPFGAVRNKSGDFITPTLESATAAAAGLATIPDDLRFSLIDAPGPSAYPICGASWAILYAQQSRDKGPELVEFLRWATHEGQEYSRERGYAPLPPVLVEHIERKLKQVHFGP